MQDRCNKTILTLFIRVAALLALSIPVTAYTDNSSRSSSGYRGSQGISSGYRGLGKNQGKHSTHNSRSKHSVAINQKNPGKSASKQRNPGKSASGNRSSHRLTSGSRDLNKSQGLQSSSRQEINHKQRENVVRHKKQGYISHNKRPGTVKQQIINGRNEHFKSRKNSVALTSKRNNPGVLTSKRKNPGKFASKQKNPVTLISKRKNPVALTFKRKNPGKSASKQKILVTHKNQGLTKTIKSRVNRTQLATIRPDKNKGKYVITTPRKSFTRPKTIGHHKNNLDKKSTVFQTQHKQHNNQTQHKQNISHSRHNQQRHHGHHKHQGHSTRFIYSPYVFFSYHSLYHPYSYYPYSYYSGYYLYAYPFYRSYGYSSPAYSYEEPVYSTNNPYGIDSPGWTYLAQGNFQAAINVFAKDIQSFPDAGIPKVGFALASAAAGNLTEGMLAMREAFQVDPDSIHYLYFDERVLTIIDDLIEQYEYEFQQNNKSPDEAFMVSTLHYLKYDYGSAHEAINRAIIDGDKSPSMGQLHRLVDDQFSNEYAGKNN